MSVLVTAPVTGAMLVKAIIWAQAKTAGGTKEKLAAGAGILERYLGENGLRRADWDRMVRLSPSVAMARACLNHADLEIVGGRLDKLVAPDQLTNIYGKMLAPHFGAGPIDPAVICPELPDHGLTMLATPDNELIISQNSISFSQFETFRGQTEVLRTDTSPDSTHRREPVIGVPLNQAKTFAGWLGMSLPVESKLLFAREALGLEFSADRSYDEWTATAEDGFPRVISWEKGRSFTGFPELVDLNRITFRVAQHPGMIR